ncbi:MAG: 4Fe-4S double cluster binding domain-containing protein [Desulfobacteraceae bacterium]|jgi:epoxyqueuosine reductase|nr:4Fe-4S double cluster binding domain-containing protein [Desulfobacteraceae bacterium]
MATSNLSETLMSALEKEGCKGKILSIEHIDDLKSEINRRYQQGLFDEEFFAEELCGFDFSASKGLPETKSLIIAAAPQPQVRVTFKTPAKDMPCIIPPTYRYATDRKMEDLLRLHLYPAGYQLKKVILPWKLLAVRSGLAQYGKNNITYIAGLGSFYRLVAFVSDIPGTGDSWGKPQIMSDCSKCDACSKACPSGAIGSDRFLLHAERCITFHNERQMEFPDWLNPSWHNCLVGCMVCQNVCPANRPFRKKVAEGPVFSETETAAILQGNSRDLLPPGAVQKLEGLDMIEYANVLGRNLGVLVKKRA